QRTWTEANANFQPDCDLQNPNAQDLRDSGRDICGQISNLLFGSSTFTSLFDPRLLAGLGVPSSHWRMGLSVQQQILPRASIEIAYNRRCFTGFTAVDNRKTQPSDYT